MADQDDTRQAEANEAENEVDKEAAKNAWTTTRLVITAMGAVGFAMGLFTGMSDSPIAKTVLPLLFATIGGSAGIYLFRTNPTDPAKAATLRVAANGIIAFAVLCVLSALYGIAIRTGTGLTDFVPSVRQPEASVVSFGSAASDLNIALLGAKLRLLGVSEADEYAVLEKAKREMSMLPDENVIANLRTLRDKVGEALVPLDQLMARLEREGKRTFDGAAYTDFAMHPVLEELYQELRSTKLLCDRWLTADKDGTVAEIPRYVLVSRVANLQVLLQQAHGKPKPMTRRDRRSMEERSIYAWLEGEDENLDITPILKVEREVASLSRTYGGGDWLGRDEEGDEFDLQTAVNTFLEKHAATQDEAPTRSKRRPHIKP